MRQGRGTNREEKCGSRESMRFIAKETLRFKSTQQQVAKATGQAKANLELRVADERAKHNRRVAKLCEAWQMVKEAAAI